MNKNIKILIIASALIVGVYFFTKKKKETPVLADTSEEETDDSQSSKNSNTTTTPKVKPDWNKILKKGSKGIEVKTLQKALKSVDVDGDFGISTEKRLKNVIGLTQISVNQYNQAIQNIQVQALKEAEKKKSEQKPKETKKVVAQVPKPTSFTDGLIKI